MCSMACALGKGLEVKTLLPNKDERNDVILFLENKKRYITKFLTKQLRQKKAIKWYLTLQVKFVKINKSNEQAEAKPYFRNKCMSSFNKSIIKKQVTLTISVLLNKFAEWIRDGSGWILAEVLALDINVAKYQPLKGKSYFKLPTHLKRKRAVINVQNKDKYCFLWCILAALYPAKIHPERISHYKKYFNTLNTTGISFPMQVNNVSKFERRNNLCVNVYEYTKENIYPLYVSRVKNFENKKKVHLLLVKNGNKHHYCLIKSLSRLFREQSGHTNRRYYCDFCLHGFTKNRLLQQHNYLCRRKEPQRVKLPEGDKTFLEFKNYFKQDKIKFAIYCDFESLLKPIYTCKPNPSLHSSTTETHIHEPCAFSYVVTSSISTFNKAPVVYRGENVVETFIEHMLKEEDEILDVLYKYTPLKMTESDWECFLNSKNCHICGKELLENELRV